MNEEDYDFYSDAYTELSEMSHAQAREETQKLAHKFGTPHFIHSYQSDPDDPESKEYAPLAKSDYDNSPDHRYSKHLVDIIHPKPKKD